MQPKITWSSVILHLLIGWTLFSGARNETIDNPLEPGGSCSSRDLDSSIMVECSKTKSSCHHPMVSSLWPQDPKFIRLLTSSRSSKRLTESLLQNLNYQETEQQRLFNINTTLYVESQPAGQPFNGFGTDLELNQIDWDGADHMIESLFRIDSGIGLSYLMVAWEPSISDQLLKKIDATLAQKGTEGGNSSLKLIYRVQSETIEGSIDLLKDSVDRFNLYTSIGYSGVAITGLKRGSAGMLKKIRDLIGGEIFVDFGDEISSEFHNDLIGIVSDDQLAGILYHSIPSRPYDILSNLKSESSPKLIIKARSTRRVIDTGDWQAAQDYAIEILNHLRHDVNIFLETNSVLEISDWSPDLLHHHSIYRLRDNHNLYHRGPRFYSMAHFSRFIEPESIRLKSWIDTAPNMFAAHYIAYKTPNRGIVVVALNSNEHLNLFRIVVDSVVIVQTNLEPKSFNTFLIPPATDSTIR